MKIPSELPRLKIPHPPRWIFFLGGIILLVLILLSVAPGLANLYTDYLWFNALGFGKTWRSLLMAHIAPVVVLFVISFVVIWVNLIVAERLAPRFRTTGTEDAFLENYRSVIGKWGRWLRILTAIVLGLLLAGAGASVWKDWILFTHAQSFGTKDPQFHKDVGFYIFRLPFYRFLISWLFDLVFVSTLVVAVAHYLNGGIRFQPPFRRITPQVKAHLSVLLGVLALVKAGDYWLGRFVLNSSNRGFVQGATYTDVKAQLPAFELLILIALVATVLFLVNIWRRGWTLPVIAVGLWALVSVLAGTVYPLYVQRFKVRPDELAKESKYIQRNISATRAGFNLTNWSTQKFDFREDLNNADLTSGAPTLENARLWDSSPARDAFDSLQAIRPFYTFNDADIDRYTIDNQQRLVLIGTRDLKQSAIPNKSWVSEHLQYTNGFGAVVAYGNTKTSDDSPTMSLAGIPPDGQPQLNKQPGVYFGEGLSGYVVVDTKTKEFQPATENQDTRTSFSGSGGVKTSSFLRKLALSIRFGDLNPLISGQVTSKSQALFVRGVRDRAQKIAPFLSFDTDPYPVILNGRITWILDGYTTSNQYPYSQNFSGSTQRSGSALVHPVNYVRNSVKVTVDAYTGKTHFYVVDKNDPILRAYRSAFPQLFEDVKKAPAGLTEHFRYPEDMFRLQTEVYGEYRLSNPADFYRLDNAWAVASAPEASGQATEITEATTAQKRASRLKPQGAAADPLYLQLAPPGQQNSQFVLMQAFSPLQTKALMSGFVIAQQDGTNYGKVNVYDVSPDQNENLPASPSRIASQSQSIQQISETESLLGRGRSNVTFGSVQVLPVRNSFVYVQSFYVTGQSSSTFPRVRFVIVSYGDQSVLAASVSDGLKQIFSGFGGLPQNQTTNGKGTSSSSTSTTTTTPSGGQSSVAQLLGQATDAF